ncbi:hypothetical protein [Myxosarcina sp. GI1]|uniref:hypothetical protein n=1 Tax=Myxosarcina sp. GI1 TaxID=1541065 RepID=UPI0009078F7A|nr:hypothetical protein [Myxosarcina sp. GI1]
MTEEDRVELYLARLENNRRIVERVRLTREQTASYLLTSRGCPQTPDSLGITDTLAHLRDAIAHLESTITHLSSSYIAPEGVEAHRYVVKRPYRSYEYNKLTSKEAIFPPQIKEQEVKVVHLSKDDDPRNIEARAGIERRNRLLAIATQIRAATELLDKAREDASSIPVYDTVTHKITRPEWFFTRLRATRGDRMITERKPDRFIPTRFQLSPLIFK